MQFHSFSLGLEVWITVDCFLSTQENVDLDSRIKKKKETRLITENCDFWVWCSKIKFDSGFFFLDMVSLYSFDCPGAHFVDQAGLELRNSPASASQVLGLKACATMPGMFLVLFLFLILYILTHTTILKIAC